MQRELKRRLAQNAQRGLTLVEIIVVLVILAVLMGFLGSTIFKKGDEAKAQLTNLKFQELKQNIYLHQMKNNALPPDLESAGIEDTKDAWGGPIQYKLLDGGRSYEMKSLGADGKDGGTGVDGDMSLKGP